MTIPYAVTETLPEGMALRETADRRWLPACAPLQKPPWLLQVVQSLAADSPPALDPLNDPTQGYHSWRPLKPPALA
jgi:hypothetical protein